MPKSPRSLPLLAVTLALAVLAAAPACDDTEPACDELTTLAECEAAPECDAQVAYVVRNGFAGPVANCDLSRFVQCHDAPAAGSPPPQPHAGKPPDEPTYCWVTLSTIDLPIEWTPCGGLDHLADNCP